MAKKQIKGQSKLLLESEPSTTAISEELHLTRPKKKKPKLKNYRLSQADLENLSSIVEAVNKVSPYKSISETTVIKALILLGKQVSPEKILKATKEVW